LINYNEIPARFQSSYRTIAFFLVLMVTAPFLAGHSLNMIRDRIFDVMNLAMLFMASLSFLGRFFSFLPTDSQGFYLGCTHHSMDLACLCGIAMVYAVHRFQKARNNKQLCCFFGCCFAGAFLVLLFASSRTSVISGVIAVLAYYGVGGSQSMLKVIKPVCALCLLLFAVTLYSPNAFSGLLGKSIKNESITLNSFTSSRSGIWQNRIDEIMESPVFGIGAHAVKYGGSSLSGTIEPGNAWLYVFSSMGVFSFLLFCWMMAHAVLRCRRFARPGSKASLVLGLLVYFSLYMMGEAHITAVGEFSCSYFWLLLSVAFYHEFGQDTETASDLSLVAVQ